MPYADYDAATGDVTVTSDWRYKELVRAVPGACWDARAKLWRLPAAWASLVTLRGVLGDELTVGDALTVFAWRLRREFVDPALALRSALSPTDDLVPVDGLFPFQRSGVDFMRTAGSGLLGDEMGVGKTVQALTLLRVVDQALPALVVCPNSVKHHWARLAATWLPEATPYVVDGPAARRRKTLKAALADPTALVILNVESVRLFSRLAPYGSVRLARCRVCDPRHGDEGLTTARCEVHDKELQAFAFRSFLLDEAHRCFPYDTLVLTDEGWLQIGDVVELRRGTRMLTYSSTGATEWRVITKRWRNQPSQLVRVRYTFGEVTCTATHRIWTERGYVEAQHLCAGDRVRVVRQDIRRESSRTQILLAQLSQLPAHVRSESTRTDRSSKQQTQDRTDVSTVRQDVQRTTVSSTTSVLLPVVQFEAQAFDDSESDERSRYAEQDEEYTTSAQPLPKDFYRWQRATSFQTSENVSGSTRLANGGRCSHQTDLASSERKVTQPLQDRYCECRSNDRDRGRRTITSVDESSTTGQEKEPRVDVAWVESVEVYESRGTDVTRSRTPGSRFLYDVEVADNHNYFADGLLVSNCKDPRAKQTRAVWSVAHQSTIRYRWALTGTPIANHVADLWSVMHAVAPDDFPTRQKFVDRYALLGWNAFGGLDVVGVRPDTRAELFRLLDPRFRRTLKAQVLPQLPPRVREVRYAELPAGQLRAYRELERCLRTRTTDGELLVAKNHLVAKTRLLQFAAANLTVTKPDPDDVTTWEVELREPSAKLDVLVEVLDELGVTARDYAGSPVLVAAEHKQLLALAGRRLDDLGVSWALLTGDVAPVDRERALDALNAGTIRALLFTSRAGGTGLDMSAAPTLVNLQRSWSLVDERQKEDRNHRIGSERHDRVLVVDVVTRGTVEEDQVTRLHEKFKRLEELTRDRATLLAANPAADVAALDTAEARLLAETVEPDLTDEENARV